MNAAAAGSCEACGAAIAQPAKQGRRRRTCSPRCRTALYRAEGFRQLHGTWPVGWRPFGRPAGESPPASNEKA